MLPILKPVHVRLMYCPVCGISTNHHRITGNRWVCWCGAEIDPENKEADEVRQTAEWLSEAESVR